MTSFPVRSPFVRMWLHEDDRSHDLDSLTTELRESGVFRFDPLPNGLFPASEVDNNSLYTGYQAVWVRDNVHLAHALESVGNGMKTDRCATALLRWFQSQRRHIDKIILSGAAPRDPMSRPHVRFDGSTFRSLPEPWNHAQNDALGAFLWLYCHRAAAGHLSPSQEDLEVLAALALYLEAISYWQDEDSGHWEEEPKVSASSIGVVVAGLIALHELQVRHEPLQVSVGQQLEVLEAARLDHLISKGQQALDRMLPAECIQKNDGTARRYDSALLFLVDPFQVVQGTMARRIVNDVKEHLQGTHGIRRFQGDTFWSPNYRDLPPHARTSTQARRDEWFARQGQAVLESGEEAQWTLFDPLLSVIHGKWFQEHGLEEDRKQQNFYFRRSLGQLVPVQGSNVQLHSPELFFLENGEWVPNDVIPLLWTHAHLLRALDQMYLSQEMEHCC